jgi:hypothetical protein
MAQTWFKELAIFRWLRDYFPVTLHKTAELDPNKNYIMGSVENVEYILAYFLNVFINFLFYSYHPHGMMAVGAFTNFATDATNFSKVLKNCSRLIFPELKISCTGISRHQVASHDTRRPVLFSVPTRTAHVGR